MALSVVTSSLPLFPTDLSFGRPGGPEYMTDVVILESGAEQRNAYWGEPRYSWDVGYSVRTMDKIAALLKFFHACKGRHQPFRFKDWLDYKSCSIEGTPSFDDQSLGSAAAGQTEFQLAKSYAQSLYETSIEVFKPSGSTIRVGVNGAEETSGWTVYEESGLIIRSIPLTGGETVTWGGEFFRKARFDTDKLSHSFAAWEAGEVEVPVIGLRGT